MLLTKALANILQATKFLPHTHVNLFHELLERNLPFINHYEKLQQTYSNSEDIKKYFHDMIINEINKLVEKDTNYKYHIYKRLHPKLIPSQFIQNNSVNADLITRFCLSLHYLPIETGRWSRTPRTQRLCKTCKTLGHKMHYIYYCCEIDRLNLELPQQLENIWTYNRINEIFVKLRQNNYI